MTNLGGIEVAEQQGLTKMPQQAASAWSAFDGSIVGAGYKPIAFVGTQIVKGLNFVFLAEQTLMTNPISRHIVLVTINNFDGKYTTVGIENVI